MTAATIREWFTTSADPSLLGARCTTCEAVAFPPDSVTALGFCRNPRCEGTEFDTVELGRRGTIWSFTIAGYPPPPPYVAAPGEFQPIALLAVELPERFIVLGQLDEACDREGLEIGAEVELAIGPLYGADGADDVVWRWRLADGGTNQ